MALPDITGLVCARLESLEQSAKTQDVTVDNGAGAHIASFDRRCNWRNPRPPA
jgi:hypothetical protein